MWIWRRMKTLKQSEDEKNKDAVNRVNEKRPLLTVVLEGSVEKLTKGQRKRIELTGGINIENQKEMKCTALDIDGRRQCRRKAPADQKNKITNVTDRLNNGYKK